MSAKVPSPEDVTICEIEGALRTRKFDEDEQEAAQDMYSRRLGKWYPTHLLPPGSDPRNSTRDSPSETVRTTEIDAALPRGVFQQLESVLKYALGSSGSLPNSHPLTSWHPSKERLAVLGTHGQDAVFIFEAASPDAPSSIPFSPSPFSSPGSLNQPHPSPPPLCLSHPMVSGVSCVAWRPNDPSTVAVGCRGGVCLWHPSEVSSLAGSSSAFAGGPGEAEKGSTAPTLLDTVRSLAARKTQLARAGAQFLDTGNFLLSLLPPSSPAPSESSQISAQQPCFSPPPLGAVSSLAFSPCGRLLAGIVQGQSAVCVWEMATQRMTLLQKRRGQPSFLKWDPQGSCLGVCVDHKYLQVWETHSWTCSQWHFGPHSVSAVEWSGDPHLALISFSSSPALRGLYVSGVPPAVGFSLLPAELPGLGTATTGPGSSSPWTGIQSMAWDPSGKRLAVVYARGQHADGSQTVSDVALYATETVPIFQARLVGYINGPSKAKDNAPKPLSVVSLSFSPTCSAESGALLAVIWDNSRCSVYPILPQTGI